MASRILHKVTAATLVGAGFSLALATPSQAAVSCLELGSQIFTTGYTCTSGDKLYSNFTVVEGLALTSAGYTISDVDPNHTIAAAGSFQSVAGPTTYSFTYTVAVTGTGIGTREFHQIKTGATSSAIGTNVWTKTLSSVPLTIPPSVISTEVSSGGESGIATYGHGVTAALFTSTLVVDQGTVTNFTDTLTQKNLEATPGPLSILGAGAAFGFSRRLRRRVSASSHSC